MPNTDVAVSWSDTKAKENGTLQKATFCCFFFCFFFSSLVRLSVGSSPPRVATGSTAATSSKSLKKSKGAMSACFHAKIVSVFQFKKHTYQLPPVVSMYRWTKKMRSSVVMVKTHLADC